MPFAELPMWDLSPIQRGGLAQYLPHADTFATARRHTGTPPRARRSLPTVDPSIDVPGDQRLHSCKMTIAMRQFHYLKLFSMGRHTGSFFGQRVGEFAALVRCQVDRLLRVSGHKPPGPVQTLSKSIHRGQPDRLLWAPPRSR